MVKVKVIQDYYDREQDKDMTVGNTFECSEERANLLTAFGVVTVVSETEESNEEVEAVADIEE